MRKEPNKRRALYEVLGVASDCAEAELRKAYKVRALQLHPDKNAANPNAADLFQQLKRAYDILMNPESRALYDETGVCPDESLANSVEGLIKSFATISEEDISAFELRYRESEMEAEDIETYFNSHGGDVSGILDWLPLSTHDDVDRIVAVVRKRIESGKLKKSKVGVFERSIKKLRAAASKLKKQVGRESKLITKSKKSGESSTGKGSTADLALAILGKQKHRCDIISELEAKYCKGKRGG